MVALRLPFVVGVLLARLGAADDEIDADAEDIQVYYETNCPYSQQFVIDEAAAIIEEPNCLARHVRFHWYPYGMATRDAAGNMNCQHGEDECKGNRIQLCAKKMFGNTRGLSKFIICHERSIRDDKKPADDAAAVGTCADQSGFPGKGAELITCSTGTDSVTLAQAAGMKTDDKHPALVPFANFVGQAELEEYNLFTGGVAGALEGAICGQIRDQNKALPECCNAALAGRRLSQDRDVLV